MVDYHFEKCNTIADAAVNAIILSFVSCYNRKILCPIASSDKSDRTKKI